MEIINRRQVGNTEFFSIKLDNGIELKDCKIVSGSKGSFVSGPARKGSDGKWYAHIYFPTDVSDAIVALAEGRVAHPEFVPNDEDIPF